MPAALATILRLAGDEATRKACRLARRHGGIPLGGFGFFLRSARGQSATPRSAARSTSCAQLDVAGASAASISRAGLAASSSARAQARRAHRIVLPAIVRAAWMPSAG